MRPLTSALVMLGFVLVGGVVAAVLAQHLGGVGAGTVTMHSGEGVTMITGGGAFSRGARVGDVPIWLLFLAGCTGLAFLKMAACRRMSLR